MDLKELIVSLSICIESKVKNIIKGCCKWGWPQLLPHFGLLCIQDPATVSNIEVLTIVGTGR